MLWLLLGTPAAMMLSGLANGTSLAMDLLRRSGEMSIRLMVLAMLPGPLSDAFGPNRFLRGWLAIRRNLGVAACAYAILHLGFYLVDMGKLAAIIEEFALSGIWTGWLALGLLIPPAGISCDMAMRALKLRWTQVQRLVYPALMLSLAHWLLLDWKWQPAVLHFAPLIVAWSLRAFHNHRQRKPQRKQL